MHSTHNYQQESADHTLVFVSSLQGWHEEDGSWTPPPADWTCGLAYHTQANISRGLPGWSPENYSPMKQGTHFIPCLFNETADFRAAATTAHGYI